MLNRKEVSDSLFSELLALGGDQMRIYRAPTNHHTDKYSFKCEASAELIRGVRNTLIDNLLTYGWTVDRETHDGNKHLHHSNFDGVVVVWQINADRPHLLVNVWNGN